LAEPLTVKSNSPALSSSPSYKLKIVAAILFIPIPLNTQVKTEKLVEDYVRTLRLKILKCSSGGDRINT
jgi:hypothetical protein